MRRPLHPWPPAPPIRARRPFRTGALVGLLLPGLYSGVVAGIVVPAGLNIPARLVTGLIGIYGFYFYSILFLGLPLAFFVGIGTITSSILCWQQERRIPTSTLAAAIQGFTVGSYAVLGLHVLLWLVARSPMDRRTYEVFFGGSSIVYLVATTLGAIWLYRTADRARYDPPPPPRC